jgi:hypothetical protein
MSRRQKTFLRRDLHLNIAATDEHKCSFEKESKRVENSGLPSHLEIQHPIFEGTAGKIG